MQNSNNNDVLPGSKIVSVLPKNSIYKICFYWEIVAVV